MHFEKPTKKELNQTTEIHFLDDLFFRVFYFCYRIISIEEAK